jgi:hypothetical protein
MSPGVPRGQAGGRADVRTDMTKLIVAFRNFGNGSKINIRGTEWDVVHWVRPVQERYNTSGEPL